jgi:hypothetical protein
MSKPCIDIETFTWSNLKSNIFQGRRANTMCLYLEKVVNSGARWPLDHESAASAAKSLYKLLVS